MTTSLETWCGHQECACCLAAEDKRDRVADEHRTTVRSLDHALFVVQRDRANALELLRECVACGQWLPELELRVRAFLREYDERDRPPF